MLPAGELGGWPALHWLAQTQPGLTLWRVSSEAQKPLLSARRLGPGLTRSTVGRQAHELGSCFPAVPGAGLSVRQPLSAPEGGFRKCASLGGGSARHFPQEPSVSRRSASPRPSSVGLRLKPGDDSRPPSPSGQRLNQTRGESGAQSGHRRDGPTQQAPGAEETACSVPWPTSSA